MRISYIESELLKPRFLSEEGMLYFKCCLLLTCANRALSKDPYKLACKGDLDEDLGGGANAVIHIFNMHDEHTFRKVRRKLRAVSTNI